jgi:hypothetical protein
MDYTPDLAPICDFFRNLLTGAKNGRSASTNGYSTCFAHRASQPGNAMGCSGGQFVHRMVSFGFRDRVAVAVSANAGTYAMPDLAAPWPFGLGQTYVDTDALRALLGFRITVMAGTADALNHWTLLPKGPALHAPAYNPL